MCKHVAAVLYGIGARLDKQPELLFRLRELDEKELIARVKMCDGMCSACGQGRCRASPGKEGSCSWEDPPQRRPF
jgi:uncharacterized Zn finger protein